MSTEENKIKKYGENSNKQDTKELFDKLHENLVEKMKEFSDNTKEYLKYLDVFRKNGYSLNNNLFIQSQIDDENKIRPAENEIEGKYMTTFKGWKDLGYKIQKGEKAFSIIMPTKVRYFEDENARFKNLRYASKNQLEKIKKGELESGEFTSYFVKKALFDIKQTNCPEQDIDKVMGKLLPTSLQATNDKNLDLLISDFKKHLETEGFKVHIKDLEPNLKGYVTNEKEIVLNSLNSNTQNFKTLLHEYGHYQSEHFNRPNLTKEIKEVEAESIAYMVAKNHGIDTSEYSFKYLNMYAKTQIEEDLIKSQEMIKKVANDINKKLAELNELRLKSLELDDKLKEQMGDLKVKIIQSENENFVENKILNLKDLNQMIEDNGNTKGELRLNVLCEKEQKVLDFTVSLDKDKGNLFNQINSNKSLLNTMKNEVETQQNTMKNKLETQITSTTTTTTKVTNTNSFSMVD